MYGILVRKLRGASVRGRADDGATPVAKLRSRGWVVGDRGFLSPEDLRDIIDSGAHAVLRVKADIDLPVLKVAPDGGY